MSFLKKNSQMLLNQAEETSNPPSGMGLSAWSSPRVCVGTLA